MFKRKTVFVVGAGGSRELDFPMGEQLKTNIASKLYFKFEDFRRVGGDNTLHNVIVNIAQQKQRDPNEWIEAAYSISTAMPLAISIDNFLHTHHENEAVVTCGKLAIAQTIAEAGKGSAIRIDRRSQDRVDFSNVKSSWHTTFVKMLLENVQRDRMEDIFENVSFITFNYDRCIEHYIVEALQEYLKIDRSEAQNLLGRLEVIHPYGKIGPLPCEVNGGGIEFGESLTPGNLLRMASQIRTFTERVDDDAAMNKIHSLLDRAEQVVFLGFSYGRMNIELPSEHDGPEQPRDRRYPQFYGTTVGMSASNVQMAHGLLSSLYRRMRGMENAKLESVTCHELLENHFLALTS